MSRWNLLDMYDRVPWNRTVLGMRLSNWCMVTAAISTSALVIWTDWR